MNDKEWLESLKKLMDFQYNDDYDYSVNYREDKQRKDRNFSFHKVQSVEETNSFIFTSFPIDWITGELEIDKVDNRLVLKDIEIIKININKKTDYTDYI